MGLSMKYIWKGWNIFKRVSNDILSSYATQEVLQVKMV
jgi:hypothetical protein